MLVFLLSKASLISTNSAWTKHNHSYKHTLTHTHPRRTGINLRWSILHTAEEGISGDGALMNNVSALRCSKHVSRADGELSVKVESSARHPCPAKAVQAPPLFTFNISWALALLISLTYATGVCYCCLNSYCSCERAISEKGSSVPE